MNPLRLFFVSMAMGLTFKAQGACRVYVPTKEFAVAGMSLRFDFTALLEPKNYKEVSSASEADLILQVQGAEIDGRFFRHATGALTLGSIQGFGDRRCFTQLCGLSDFGKAFREAYGQLQRRLPECRE